MWCKTGAFLLLAVVMSSAVWADSSERRLSQRATFVGMPFVWVPEGCFTVSLLSRGQFRETSAATEQCVTGFWLGESEVTQAQWKAVMGANPSHFSACGDHCPVEQVSWFDVQDFIAKLNTKRQGKFSLPDEIQWEYACRSGGKEHAYSGGDAPRLVAWYDGSWIRGSTRLVAQKKPNALGLYDMNGNVWEWVRSQPRVKPGLDKRQTNRGGSWLSHVESVDCQQSHRFDPAGRDRGLGLRLLREK